MSYKYAQSVPFKYKRHVELKSVNFTDEIRSQFDSFYQYIDSLCKDDYLDDKDKLDKNKMIPLITELSARYKELRTQYIKPVVEEQYKYKELLYTQEEVDFIFACSYALIDKFGFSQIVLAKIFGFNKNKFSKLGCFPVRCYDAYTKLDDVDARKSLLPNDSNSIGIQIAECINKKVQAVYACSAFIGVSNDLDLFANISSTDRKAYVLTSPMQFNDDETPSLERANYAFGRYQFALGNQMFNDKGEYVPVGVLKEKIVAMLTKGDIEVLSPEEQDVLIREMLLRNVDMEKCMNIGCRYSEFQKEREEYRAYYEDMIIAKERVEGEYRSSLVECYVDDYDPKEEKKAIFLDEDEIVEKYYLKNKKEFEKQEQKILRYINFPTLLESKAMLIEAIRRAAKSKDIFKNPSGSGNSGNSAVFTEPTHEDMLRSAASYWIAEVFDNYNGNEDYLKEVMDYLGKKSPIFAYLDSLNYVPSGKIKEINPTERKNTHIYMRDEKMDISSELKGLRVKLVKDEKCPIMIYLDKGAVGVEEGSIKRLLSQHRSVLIVRDTNGEVASYMEVLNEELGLYIKCSEEIN